MKERERDKALILSILESHGILPPDLRGNSDFMPQMTPELSRSIYQFLALTPCKLLLVSLDDIIGTLDQQNMPGTLNEHPNWMQKTPLPLEEIVTDKRFADLAALFNTSVL